MKKILSWFACLFLVLALTSGSKVTTVFVIGDSTAAEKGNAKNNPERGWGMVLQGCFDDKIIVDNHAVVEVLRVLSMKVDGRKYWIN